MLQSKKFRPAASAIRTGSRVKANPAPISSLPRPARLICQWAPDKAMAQVEQKELRALSPALDSVTASHRPATVMAAAVDAVTPSHPLVLEPRRFRMVAASRLLSSTRVRPPHQWKLLSSPIRHTLRKLAHSNLKVKSCWKSAFQQTDNCT